MHELGSIEAAEVVVPCEDLDATLEFFTKQLGFRIDVIFPADHPEVAVVSGYGARLRLDARAEGPPGALRLLVTGAVPGGRRLVAPNGTVVELVDADPPLVLPPVRQSLVVTKLDGDAQWGAGRAGMRYRDLVPDRQGGRFIASHIVIPDGGPVPDYVHFHKVRFQMIFCRRGWVTVAYEDQGEPITIRAGDCFLQPPEIRHRVLESSPGLEVVEIGCPAEHETRVDHELGLPTGRLLPERDFGGQRFVHHVAATAPWHPWLDGYEYQDTGIGTATAGLAGARVVRPAGTAAVTPAGTPAGFEYRFDNEFHFLFVLEGSVTLRVDGVGHGLGGADSVVVPSEAWVTLREPSDDLHLLQVSLPADLPFERRGPEADA